MKPFAKAMEDPVAQLVEQLPFKPWVEGSSPSRITFQEFLRISLDQPLTIDLGRGFLFQRYLKSLIKPEIILSITL